MVGEMVWLNGVFRVARCQAESPVARGEIAYCRDDGAVITFARAPASSCLAAGSVAGQRGRTFSLQFCLTKSSIKSAVVLGSMVTPFSSGAGGAFTLDHSSMMV